MVGKKEAFNGNTQRAQSHRNLPVNLEVKMQAVD